MNLRQFFVGRTIGFLVVLVLVGLGYLFFGRVGAGNIIVEAPRAGEVVSSPLELSGKARTWYFEGSFGVEVLDANRQLLGQHFVSAQGDWMTTEFVPFLGEVNFSTPTTETGFVVFHKDNPSGKSELDESFEVPVRFVK